MNKMLKDFLGLETNVKILIGLISTLAILLLIWMGNSLYRKKVQHDDLIKRGFSGILISSKDIYHGDYLLTIKQHGTGEEIKYYLHISKFLKDNNIHKGDSISKKANDRTMEFFQKKNGTFDKCCDFYVF